ncbi:MAG: hypothetical protein OXE75_09130, partial [bacterium]|nr:hypothetical protein [bacterium]
MLVLVLAVGLVVPSWPFGDDADAEAQTTVAPECREGYEFDPASGLCERTEFDLPVVSCSVGTKIGHRGGVSCRVDHGAAVPKPFCVEGRLVYVGPPVGGVWRCAVATVRTESRLAEPYCTRGTPPFCEYTEQVSRTLSRPATESCSPRGTPPSCRYTERVARTETRDATRYCTPRGAPPSCRYTEQVTRTVTEDATEYCSPRGTPPLCRYTARVPRTETRDATRYCTPRGTPPFCRYTATETEPARLVYVGGVPVGYACPSGWSLSGSECSRR